MGEVNPFSVGDWIQWVTEHSAKRGEVVVSAGPSIVVHWLGGDEQVFPVVEGYLTPQSIGAPRMEVIQRPKEANRIAREQRHGVMSVHGAAASLGTTPKRVRAMLRSGQLRGVQKEGKWVSVDL